MKNVPECGDDKFSEFGENLFFMGGQTKILGRQTWANRGQSYPIWKWIKKFHGGAGEMFFMSLELFWRVDSREFLLYKCGHIVDKRMPSFYKDSHLGVPTSRTSERSLLGSRRPRDRVTVANSPLASARPKYPGSHVHVSRCISSREVDWM